MATRLFLSHSKHDRLVAQALHIQLSAHGFDCFFDEHPDDGIRLAADWQNTIVGKVLDADLMIALVSAKWDASRWCLAEVVLARSRGIDVVPLWLDDTRSGLLDAYQGMSYSGPDDAEALLDRLRHQGKAAFKHAPQDRSPFPGLSSFTIDDAAVFPGRRRLAARFVLRLTQPSSSPASRVAIAVGPSGVGKSSLVAAGVLGQLREFGWTVLPTLRPTRRPLVAFAADLGVASAGDRDAVAEAIVHRVTDLAGAGDAVLPLDQAEELFTLIEASEDRDWAFGLLLRLLEEIPRVRIVASLRSEYLGDWMGHPLAAMLSTGAFEVVSPLDPDELAGVITESVRNGRLQISGALVAKMVRATGDGTALPLLSFILQSMAAQAKLAGNDELTDEMYVDSGEIEGAVAHEADLASACLEARGIDRSVTLASLLALVNVDNESGADTRRRAKVSELDFVARQVIEEFESHRLVTVDGDADTATVSHEALLSAWGPLDVAIDENRQLLQAIRHVQKERSSWERHDRDESRLLSAAEVHDVAGLATSDVATARLQAPDRAFVVFSAASRDAMVLDFSDPGWLQAGVEGCMHLLTTGGDEQKLAACRLALSLAAAPSELVAALLALVRDAKSESVAVAAAFAAAHLGEVGDVVEIVDAAAGGSSDEATGRRDIVLATLRNDPATALAITDHLGPRRLKQLGWKTSRLLLADEASAFLTVAVVAYAIVFGTGLVAGMFRGSVGYSALGLALSIAGWRILLRRWSVDGGARVDTRRAFLTATYAPAVAAAVVGLVGLGTTAVTGLFGFRNLLDAVTQITYPLIAASVLTAVLLSCAKPAHRSAAPNMIGLALVLLSVVELMVNRVSTSYFSFDLLDIIGVPATVIASFFAGRAVGRVGLTSADPDYANLLDVAKWLDRVRERLARSRRLVWRPGALALAAVLLGIVLVVVTPVHADGSCGSAVRHAFDTVTSSTIPATSATREDRPEGMENARPADQLERQIAQAALDQRAEQAVACVESSRTRIILTSIVTMLALVVTVVWAWRRRIRRTAGD